MKKFRDIHTVRKKEDDGTCLYKKEKWKIRNKINVDMEIILEASFAF